MSVCLTCRTCLSVQAPSRKTGGSQRKPADIKPGSVKKIAPIVKENGKHLFSSHLIDYFNETLLFIYYIWSYIITGEEQLSGGVAWPVFRLYMASCGGSAPCLLILALFVLNVGSSAFCQWWLSYWINQGSGVRHLFFFFTSSSVSMITDNLS